MSQELRFDGRVGVITGAGRGLGAGYARELARRGASLVLNDLGATPEKRAELEGVVEECNALGGRAVAVPGDISTMEVGAALIDEAVSRFGRIDFVVNNAGIGQAHTFADATYEDLMRMFAIHVGGHFTATKAAWPHFVAQGYGRIVSTGSNAGLYGMDEATAYSAAKGGVIGMAKTIARDGATHGITSNIITPAAFTPMAVEMVPEYAETMRDPFPLEAVAPVVAWLAHESCTVTGEVLDVKGGGVRAEYISAAYGTFQENITAESVAAAQDEIFDRSRSTAPADVVEADNWIFDRRGDGRN